MAGELCLLTIALVFVPRHSSDRNVHSSILNRRWDEEMEAKRRWNAFLLEKTEKQQPGASPCHDGTGGAASSIAAERAAGC